MARISLRERRFFRSARLSACVFLLCAGAALARPQRIVSENLCADQLLLALADPDQIASLSPLARDPHLSYLAARAGGFPQNRGSGEDVVRRAADLVLAGPYDSAATRALLAARGVPVAIVAPWTDFASGEAALRDIAARLGHADRGERLVAEIEAARVRARDIVPAGAPRPTSLVLERRGFVYQQGLVADIGAAAGLVDAAPQLGIRGSGFVSLEALVAVHPDYLIVAQADAGTQDQGQALLDHPALRRLWPASRRLVLPDRLTLCEGPATPALIDRFAAEIRAKVAAPMRAAGRP